MTNKIINTSIKISTLAVAVLAVFNLIGSNLLATQGGELSQVLAKTAAVKKQNTVLANQIAQQSSLATLDAWAQTQGFVQINQPIALTTPAPVAYVAQ